MKESESTQTKPEAGQTLAPTACSTVWVKQKDRSGCALACVAMLAKKSYDWVRAAWFNSGRGDECRLRSVGSGAGLSRGDMIDLLAWVGLKDAPVVEAPCIVSIRTKYDLRHCVVVNEFGKILDPAEDGAGEGCLCQWCGHRYRVDFILPDYLWEEISERKNGDGLMCGKCIVGKLEENGFSAWRIVTPSNND